jgi:TonB family protein
MLREFPTRIKIEPDVQATMLLEEAAPVYPSQASGTVRLTIIVGNDGNVLEVRPISGPDDLVAEATEAVKRWKYRPTTLNGRPVEVQSTVELLVP